MSNWTHDPHRDGAGCTWCGAFAQVDADNLCIDCWEPNCAYCGGDLPTTGHCPARSDDLPCDDEFQRDDLNHEAALR